MTKTTLAVAAALCFTLTACGGGSDSDAGDSPASSSTPTPSDDASGTPSEAPSDSPSDDSGSDAGSGDSKLSGDEATASENLSKSLLENAQQGGAAGLTDISPQQATCVSDGIVDQIGIERLQQYKVLDQDLKVTDGNDIANANLGKADADALAATFSECIDVSALISKQFADQPGITKQQQTCVTDALRGDVIETFLSLSFQGKAAKGTAQLQKVLLPCLSPS